MEYICKNCGKVFNDCPSAKRLYCCSSCTPQAYKKGHNARKNHRKCLACGKIFNPTSYKINVGFGKYCSKTCFIKISPGGFGHRKGTPLSMETKRKISVAHKGLPSPSKGIKRKPFTEEHKRKIGEASKGRTHSLQTREKMSENCYLRGKFREFSPNWKGGKRMHPCGYVYIYAPNYDTNKYPYIFEHRLIMERHLGRHLEANEVVHHINEVRTDNRLENLQLLTKSSHTKLHNLLLVARNKRKNTQATI